MARRPRHDYRLRDRVSPLGCYPSQGALTGLTPRFAIPGRSPGSPVRNGEISDASVGPFKGRIVTYINGTTSVNVTLPDHIFYNGSVTRTTSVGMDGAIYVDTHGAGTNSSDAIALLNQISGPIIFEGLDAQEAAYVSASGICQ